MKNLPIFLEKKGGVGRLFTPNNCLPPIFKSVAGIGCYWLSVRFFIWCELGFKQRVCKEALDIVFSTASNYRIIQLFSWKCCIYSSFAVQHICSRYLALQSVKTVLKGFFAKEICFYLKGRYIDIFLWTLMDLDVSCLKIMALYPLMSEYCSIRCTQTSMPIQPHPNHALNSPFCLQMYINPLETHILPDFLERYILIYWYKDIEASIRFSLYVIFNCLSHTRSCAQ